MSSLISTRLSKDEGTNSSRLIVFWRISVYFTNKALVLYRNQGKIFAGSIENKETVFQVDFPLV